MTLTTQTVKKSYIRNFHCFNVCSVLKNLCEAFEKLKFCEENILKKPMTINIQTVKKS